MNTFYSFDALSSCRIMFFLLFKHYFASMGFGNYNLNYKCKLYVTKINLYIFLFGRVFFEYWRYGDFKSDYIGGFIIVIIWANWRCDGLCHRWLGCYVETRELGWYAVECTEEGLYEKRLKVRNQMNFVMLFYLYNSLKYVYIMKSDSIPIA